MTTITPVDVSTGTGPIQTSKQQITNEAPQQAPQGATKPTEEAMSPKLAMLAKQHKAVREQQRALAAERQAFLAEKQAHADKFAEVDTAKAWKERLKADPYGVMLETGLTADQVAAVMLNQPDPRDQKLLLLQQKLDALEASQSQSSSKFEEIQTQQYENAKKQIRNEVTLFVDGDSSFEMIKAGNAQEAIVELIEATYNETGDLMTAEAAAKEVEDYLVEEAMKYAKLQKIQSKLNPAPAQEPQKPVPQQSQKPVASTLSNRIMQSATKPLSGKERRERAILAFQGQLK